MVEEQVLSVGSDWTAVISQLVRERRTIRKFTADPMPVALLEQLLKSAAESVASENDELPCRFLCIASEEGKKKAASIIMGTYSEQQLYKWIPNKVNQLMVDRIVKIPAILIVLMDKRVSKELYDRHFATICAMLQSFSLLAWEQGIGMVWGTGEILHKDSFISGLGLQTHEQVHCLIYMGRYEKVPKIKPRTPASKKLTILT